MSDENEAGKPQALVVMIDVPGYQGPERRQDHIEWRSAVDQRLDAGAQKMRDLRTELAENTLVTQRVEVNTAELVELLGSFKGAMAVLTMLGKLARPLAYIAMAIGAVLTLIAAAKGLAGLPK